MSKKEQKNSNALFFLAFFLVFSLLLKTAFCAEGESISFDETNPNKCIEVHPGSKNDFYVDPQGLCAPCSDKNDGSINSPWCTLQRALNFSEKIHFSGGKNLYLREGIYRFDALSITFNDIIPNNGLSGTKEIPTLISSYPGEHARVYGSVSPKGWERKILDNGEIVWVFDWYSYLKKNYPWYTSDEGLDGIYSQSPFDEAKKYAHVPQAVFIDEHGPLISEPIIFKQANESKTIPPIILYSLNYKNNYFTEGAEFVYDYYNDYLSMPKGYVYYETDKENQDFGKIFLKVPSFLENEDINSLPVEIPLQLGLSFGYNKYHSYLEIENISFRYFNGLIYPLSGGLVLNGDNIILRNVSISYHPFVGLFGTCHNCKILNSTFAYNGNVGTQLRGNNVVYESNFFLGNSWRPFYQGFSSGGAKLIYDYFNFTFKNNFFVNNMHVGLWLDYTGDGKNIGKEKKTWDNYEGAGHIIENNVFINGGLAIETSPGTAEKPIIVRNNFFMNTFPQRKSIDRALAIHASPYVYVENNIFYNLSEAVVVWLPDMDMGDIAYGNGIIENLARQNQDGVKVKNNLFINVSVPLTIATQSMFNSQKYPKSFKDFESDYNLFFGTYKDYERHKIIKEALSSRSKFNTNEGYFCIAAYKPAYSPLKCPKYEIVTFLLEPYSEFEDGNPKAVRLSNSNFNFYSSQKIENIENTPLFVAGFSSLGAFFPTWDIFDKFNLYNWRLYTEQDKNSVEENPKMFVLADTNKKSLSINFGNDNSLSKINFNLEPFEKYPPKCNNNYVCEEGENKEMCPNDCPILTIAQMTDIHIEKEGTSAFQKGEEGIKSLESMIARINEQSGIDAVVVTGDITEDGELINLNKAKELFDKLNTKHFVVMGNHEIPSVNGFPYGWPNTKTFEAYKKQFREVFGLESHTRGISLDDSHLLLLMDCGSTICTEQELQELEKIVSENPDKKILLFFQYYGPFFDNTIWHARIWEALKNRELPTVIFVGHLHQIRTQNIFGFAVKSQKPEQIGYIKIFKDKIIVNHECFGLECLSSSPQVEIPFFNAQKTTSCYYDSIDFSVKEAKDGEIICADEEKNENCKKCKDGKWE